MPLGQRRKIDKSTLEEYAMMSSLLHQVAAQAMKASPLDPEVINDQWIALFERGDATQKLELSAALQDRSSKFQPEDFTQMKDIISRQNDKRPIPGPDGGSRLALHNIEADAFKLLKSQIDYDLQCLRVAKDKDANWATRVYHAKLKHREERNAIGKKLASQFLDSYACFSHFKTKRSLYEDIQQFIQTKTAAHRLCKEDVAAALGVLN